MERSDLIWGVLTAAGGVLVATALLALPTLRGWVVKTWRWVNKWRKRP